MPAAGMPGWLLDVVACPAAECAGRLAARPGGEALVCRRCGTLYPVLDGVPVLVPSPCDWMAAYREPILASLAERGRADRKNVEVVEAFAAGATGVVESLRFGDDWVDGEDAQPMDPELATLVSRKAGPTATLMTFLPATLGTALDVGTGDGELAAALRKRCARLAVADLSLRAVLRARAGARGREPVAGIVLDAQHLPVRKGRLDAITAANLVDLLAQPDAFLVGARAALRRRGHLALSVPDPTGLDARLTRAGFVIEREADAVLWPRMHGPRHVQIYLPRVLTARPARSQ